MKSRKLTWVTATTLFAALAIPARLAAQHTRFKLIDIDTFGGPNSTVFLADDNYNPVLNNRGTVTGFAATPIPDPFPNFPFFDDLVSHAFQWQNGTKTDLGALKESVSSASAWISANGLIAGWSQNGLTDPLFPRFPVSHAVLWKHGEVIDLGTLDGGK